MIEVAGDYWELAKSHDTLVCTINMVVKANGELVMGKGIALEFAERYPFLPQDFGKQIKDNLARTEPNSTPIPTSYLVDGSGYEKILLGLPTKIHWQDKSTLFLVDQSLYSLRQFIDSLPFPQTRKVLMTRPGCGNGGLAWDDVMPLCARYLDERFTICHKE